MSSCCSYIVNRRNKRCTLPINGANELCIFHMITVGSTGSKYAPALSPHHLLFIDSYPRIAPQLLEIISRETLIHTAKIAGISHSGTKEALLSRIIKTLRPTENFVASCFQKIWRGHRERLAGPAKHNRKICVNDTDFLSFDSIEDIPDREFFSYRDTDNFIYGFTLSSFMGLLDKYSLNPYNRREIPKYAINSARCLLRIHGPLRPPSPTPELTLEQRINLNIIQVFQKIDSLGFITSSEWFSSLTVSQLNVFICAVFDLWMYRSGLSMEEKRNITGGESNIFSGELNIRAISQYSDNLLAMRVISLQLIDKLVSGGITREYQINGAIYVLSCLATVNRQVSIAIPWIEDI
jgi:hypothetical protein